MCKAKQLGDVRPVIMEPLNFYDYMVNKSSSTYVDV